MLSHTKDRVVATVMLLALALLAWWLFFVDHETSGPVPVPEALVGRWYPHKPSNDLSMEVLEFDSDWSYERYEIGHRSKTRARGKFSVQGDVVLLDPELFASRPELCGGANERRLVIRRDDRGLALQLGSEAFRRAESW